MERREEAETYHPAVHTQRRQQIVCTLDEVLGVPLIAQHHVLRGSVVPYHNEIRLSYACTKVRLVRSGRLCDENGDEFAFLVLAVGCRFHGRLINTSNLRLFAQHR